MTIIKKFEPEQPKNRFSKRLVISIAGCLLVLVLAEIWVSNTVITYGEKFEKPSSLQKILNSANQILENEIAKYSSLSNVATHSASLGFSKVESVQYIR